MKIRWIVEYDVQTGMTWWSTFRKYFSNRKDAEKFVRRVKEDEFGDMSNPKLVKYSKA